MAARRSAFLVALVSMATWGPPAHAQQPAFRIEEATIAAVHAAMQDGTLTCRALLAQYLRRIEAYDRNGPALNAIVAVNEKVLDQADALDRRLAGEGLTGPLHCVPVIVKDNFETIELATTAGSLSLEGFMSGKDAFLVRRMREAGALVLAKSNMAEFAFSPYETVGSTLPGYTKNPYALDRVTAGSSGGTAAAVAANFGLVGLGTDTGNSIRGPSAHQSLVGIRSTMGLTSRAGVVPLNLAADIAGPMTRTVADAVAVFQVIAGEDPDDPVTAASRGRPPVDYAASLVEDGLKGARIGVLRQAYERPTLDPEVADLFAAALRDMERAGATIVDPVLIEGLDERREAVGGGCSRFKFDLNAYLASHGSRAPVRSLAEIVESGKFHPSVRRRLEMAQQAEESPQESDGCRQREAFRAWLRDAVTDAMDETGLDGLVYPTWSNAPRLIGDLNTPHGDNSQLFSPSTGFPAINVPMGFLRGGTLPAGLTLFGRAWSEPVLIRLAYGYEQATRHRRPPTSVPPLRIIEP